ncbi:hypothetical protein JL722_5858 [Aureococcus anophagefferens]|nr:hypothetical protein JL722_5858 [Aureococcus anophagefferens]
MLMLKVYDWDQLSSPDFMGTVAVKLEDLGERGAVPGLVPAAQRGLEGARRAARRPRDRVPLPPRPEARRRRARGLFAVEEHAKKAANALRVVVVRATNLPAMDASLIGRGGSSDPFVEVALGGEKRRTPHISKDLNPVWLAEFDVPAEDVADGFLELRCFDYDLASGDDLIGSVNVPLEALHADRAPVRAWYELDLATRRPKSPGKRGTLLGRLSSTPPASPTKAAKTSKRKSRIAAARKKSSENLAETPQPPEDEPPPTAAAPSKSRLEVALRMVHNPDYVLHLEKGLLDVKSYKTKKPNELRVVRAWHVLRLDERPEEEPEFLDEADAHPPVKPTGPGQELPKVEVAMRYVHNPLLVHELPKNSVEDPNPRKAANELRVVFVQARNLPIMDRNALIHRSGGSTDPFLVATLDGDEVSTSVKTKALDPVWLDARQMPVEVLDDDLHVECFDHDETSGPDFVGACVISIRELADRKLVVPLPTDLTRDNFTNLEANELRVCVIRCRNLKVLDRKIIGKKVVDPYVEIVLVGTTYKTSVKKRDVNPLFMETRVYDVNAVEVCDAPLQITVWDDDELRSEREAAGDDDSRASERSAARAPATAGEERPRRDLVGDADAVLEPLLNRELHRAWYPLVDETGASSGKIEVAMRWVHNPKKTLTIPEAFNQTNRPLDPTKEPNELFVLVMRGSRLPAMDAPEGGEAKGSSDPYVTLKLGSLSLRTSVKKAEVNPLWLEPFATRLKPAALDDEPDLNLEVVVADYDDDLSSELMGRCVVPLRSLLDQPKQKRNWFKLRNGPPNLPGGSLELLVHWAHNVPLDLLEQEEALLEQERLELLDAEIVAAQPVAVDADAPGPLAQHVADEARNVKGRPPNTLEVCLVRAANLKAGHRSGDVPRPRKVLTPVPDSSAVAELYTLKGDVWQQAKDGKLTPNEQRLRRRLHAATELTPVKVQDRVPQWLAASTLRLPRHAEAVDASTLVVRTFDDLADDPAKATGAATIPLAKIRTFAAVDAGWRAWHDLGDEFHERGQVDVWLRLSYDPSIVPEEVLEDEVEAPEALSEPANELKVVVVGARVRTQHTRRNKHLLHKDSIEVARDLGMAVADDDAAEEQSLSSFERLAKQHHDSEEASHASSMHQNLLKLGGLEATLKFMGRDRHTRLAPWDDSDKALRLTTGKCPAYWREAFNFVAKDDRDGVDVILTEVDDHGKKFYLGQCHTGQDKGDSTCHIKMADLTHRKPVRKFYPIERGHKGGADADVQSAAEIEFARRRTRRPCRLDGATRVAVRTSTWPGPSPWTRATTSTWTRTWTPDAVPRWFYAEGEAEGDAPEAVGPHNLHDLKEFWKHRTITNDTRVWRSGLPAWTPVDELHVLKRILWDYPALPPPVDPADATTGNEWPGRAYARFPDRRLGDVVPDAEVDVDAELAKLKDLDMDVGVELDADEPADDVACGKAVLDPVTGPYSPGDLRGRKRVIQRRFNLSDLRDAYETGRLGPDALVWRAPMPGEDEAAEDLFGPLVSVKALPTWGRRQACEGCRLVQCDVLAQCELCGGLATLHSVDALALQLAEGDRAADDIGEEPRPPKPALQPRAGSTIDAKEVVDGLVWVGGRRAAEETQLAGLHVTHLVRVVDKQPATVKVDKWRAPTLQEEMETRELTDWEMRLVEHDAEKYDHALPPHSPRKITMALAAGAGDGDAECVLVLDEERRTASLKEALEKFYDFLKNSVSRWTSSTGEPMRVLLYDDVEADGPPVRAALVAAAYVAREEGWASREALAFLGPRLCETSSLFAAEDAGDIALALPDPWVAELEALAAETVVGRLFCADCFENWRFGAVDDVLSTRVAAAVRRLRARDAALEVLDLRGEGPLDGDAAGVLGAAAGHALDLVSLDLSACGLGDAGAAAVATGLLHGTSGAARRRPSTVDLLGADDLIFDGVACPLTALDLSHNALSHRGARSLGRALRYHELLVSLDVAHNRLGSPGGVAILEAFVQPDEETMLAAKAYEYGRGKIDATKETDEEKERIADRALAVLFFNCSVTALNLAGNALGGDAALALARAFRRNQSLAHVDCSDNPCVFDADVYEDRSYVKRFGGDDGNYVTGEAPRDRARTPLECFGHLRIYNKSLASLDLSYVELEEDALFAIGKWAAAKQSKARALRLKRCGVDVARAKVLADVLATAQAHALGAPLERLDLSFNPLGDAGAAHISAALAVVTHGVRTLCLAQTALDPEGCAALFSHFDPRLSAVVKAHAHVLGAATAILEQDGFLNEILEAKRRGIQLPDDVSSDSTSRPNTASSYDFPNSRPGTAGSGQTHAPDILQLGRPGTPGEGRGTPSGSRPNTPGGGRRPGTPGAGRARRGRRTTEPAGHGRRLAAEERRSRPHTPGSRPGSRDGRRRKKPKLPAHLLDDKARVTAFSRLEKLGEKQKKAAAMGNARDAFPATTITDLDLGDNFCGVNGARALVAALKMAAFEDRPAPLTALRLSNARVSLRGAEVLGDCLAAGALPRLAVLDVSSNAIQDSGAAALAKAIAALPNLRRLDLGYNNLSEAATFALRSHLQTTSRSSEESKLLALDVGMMGNGVDEGDASAPGLARSKLSLRYEPTTFRQKLPKNPYVARKDLAKAVAAMGGMAGATARD